MLCLPPKPLLVLPIGKKICIGLRLGHKKIGLNFTHCVSDIWNLICTYDGWACYSIEGDAYRWEVLNLMREIFSLKFENLLKGKNYIMNYLFSHMSLTKRPSWKGINLSKILNVLNLFHRYDEYSITLKSSGCNHNPMSQWWQRTQLQMDPFWTFWFIRRNYFLKDFFGNMFLKIFPIPPINYVIFC
jgi:hypothetical protein